MGNWKGENPRKIGFHEVRILIFVLGFIAVLVMNCDKCLGQKLSSQEAFEKYRATLQLRGNIYGLTDEHVHLVLEGRIPDSLKIDTLSVGSTLIVTKDGEQYLKVDSASQYSFFVETGHQYLLVYTHPDYVTKRVVVDATSIPIYAGDLVMTMDMSMFSPNVATEMEEPLCILSYSNTMLHLDWDKEQFDKQVAKMLKGKR